MQRSTPGLTLFILLVTLVTLTATSLVMAYPMHGDLWEVRQPDGTMITVKIFGDEYYRVVESLDGYTLVRDPSTDIVCYARLSADGNELESTGVRVGSANPAVLGVEPHVRINKETAYIEMKRQRDLDGVGMPGEYTPPTLAPPSTGNVTGLLILIDFDDVPGTIPAGDFDDYCNQVAYSDNGNNGSIRDYFLDASDGLLDYTTWVTPNYYRADSLKSYYDDCAINNKSTVKELVKEALSALDAAGHDFSVYDSNSDGYIDAINVFYAGAAGCPWSFGLWPSSGGITDDLTLDGVKTDRYQITNIGTSLTIGTYIHENGHMILGLPDLYDTGFDARGIGRWGLMGYQYSKDPQEPCAWSKIRTGWATPTVIAANQTGVNLGSAGNNANILKFESGDPLEYFLVENRGQSDSRDGSLPDSGVLFWHIDENMSNNNDQSMTPGGHYRITVVQADNDWDLENDVNGGDSGDLFHAPNDDAFTPCTAPDTDWWDGTASGFHFTGISASAINMTFDFSIGDSIPVAQCKSYGADADTDCCIDVAVSDIDDGSYDPNGPGDIASLLITAVDGNPVTPAASVEVCGDGDHTVTLTITDLCGNTSSCDADVEVENDAPVALCKSYTADADTNCCIWVRTPDIDDGSYDPDGSGDIASFGITAIDGNPTASVMDSVQVCGNGWHTVTLTVTDWCDSTSSCDADVEVVDVTPPDIVTSLNRDCLWPPNHKMVDIIVDIEVTDNCDPDPYWELYEITSNEPDNGKGDGNTVGDIEGAATTTEDTSFALRSERSGKGDGRKYTIVYRAEDASGNVAFDTSCVIVPHDMGHGVVCAFGFNVFGTGFKADARTFTVVIPSTEAVYQTKGNRELLVKPAVDASEIDVTRAYVGNTGGVLRPIETTILDVNGDGLDDLALTYKVSSATAIPTGQWLSPADGLGEAAKHGSLGLHFMGQDETPFLASDIFALGSPIDIRGEDDPEPRFDKGDPLMDVTSDANVKFSNGIASIYPNPFNPATTVRFTLAQDADVTIGVYDVSGALVRILVDRNLSSGEHTAAWDGTDAHGQSVATGVYFARMITGSFEMTRKMVLVK